MFGISKIENILFADLEIEPLEQPLEMSKKCHFNIPSEFSLEVENVPDDIIEKLGIDKNKFPKSYQISFLVPVQARTHKKKRINKKWLKRYGYKMVQKKSDGWKFKTHTDGSFEFVK